ncbi:SLATT domain-containing protein [Vibrio ponticus]|uniref:SLATT domain-containing protein n=1 Tax=Vibrio ponticus TaxID=265668 RepID=UPI001617850D|nr:SLATT domain-containing protein [Vibrio ponticus]
METSSIDVNFSDSFLLTEVDQSIKTLKLKVNRLKRRTKTINALTLALGALITVTLGLTVDGYEEVQRNVALCLGALLTAVNGWGVIFDYKMLWIRQKSTLLNLYQLKNDIKFARSLGSLSIKDHTELFERYQSIWEENGSEWRNLHRTIKQPTHPTNTGE